MADHPPDTRPPLLRTGPNDQAATVLITASVLLIVSSLNTCMRLADVWTKKRPFNHADALIVAANLFAIAQTTCVNLAAKAGLGRHLDDLSPSQSSIFFKTLYVAGLLAVPAMTCAKFSLISLGRLLDSQGRQMLRQIFVGIIIGWALFALFALAFQCGLPSPWDYTARSCLHGDLIYVSVSFNILTDFYLSVFIIPSLWNLEIPISTRISAMAFFVPRLLACAAEIAQLVVLRNSFKSEDQPWAQAPIVAMNQVVMNLSIITASLPALKRFLTDLQTGQSGARLTDRHLQWELSRSASWIGSKARTMTHTTVTNGSTSQHEKLSTERRDLQRREDEGRGREIEPDTAILRRVEVSVEIERTGIV